MTNTIIITIISTVFIYNLIGSIIYLVSKQNEGYTAIWALGLIYLITNSISFIYGAIRKHYIEKNFKSLLADEQGNLYYCDSKQADYHIYENEDIGNIKFARDVVNKYNITDGWMKCHCNKLGNDYVLSARYVPLKICLLENAKKI